MNEKELKKMLVELVILEKELHKHIEEYKADGNISKEEKMNLKNAKQKIYAVKKGIKQVVPFLKKENKKQNSLPETVFYEDSFAATDDIAMQFMPMPTDFPNPDWGGIERDIYLALDYFRNRVLIDLQSIVNAFLEGTSSNKSFTIGGNVLSNILINAFGVDNVLSIVEDTLSIFQGALKNKYKNKESLTMTQIKNSFKDLLDSFVKDNKKHIFLSFKDKYDCKSEEEINEAFANIKESFSKNIISGKQLKKAMTLVWIKGAKDSYKDADDYAGVFKVKIEYRGEFKYDGTPTGNVNWKIKSCEVDDVPNPGGTKAALIETYSKDTLLESILEIATVVYIDYSNHFEANRYGIESITASGYKRSNDNKWIFANGNKKLFNSWVNSDKKFHPTLDNL